MIVYKCDLCDQLRECVQKNIDGKSYDLCLECWNPIEAKLKGKGRTPGKERSEAVLPRPIKVGDENEERKPFPGTPPKTWMKSESIH